MKPRFETLEVSNDAFGTGCARRFWGEPTYIVTPCHANNGDPNLTALHYNIIYGINIYIYMYVYLNKHAHASQQLLWKFLGSACRRSSVIPDLDMAVQDLRSTTPAFPQAECSNLRWQGSRFLGCHHHLRTRFSITRWFIIYLSTWHLFGSCILEDPKIFEPQPDMICISHLLDTFNVEFSKCIWLPPCSR